MKKLSAILVMVLVLMMTVVTVSADSVGYKLTPSKATVAAGEEFTIDVLYTPSTTNLAAADVLIGYDPALVQYVDATPAVSGQTYTKKNNYPSAGFLTLSHATDFSVYYTGGKLSTVTFRALVDGSATFTVDITSGGGIMDDQWGQFDSVTSKEGTTVTIGSVTPPVVEKKFEVSAVENTDKTVVTVKDSSEVAAGTVYVANYVDDVLVSCESKPLADGDLEFAITGNVKVFVWDANNVPLVNEVIEL